MNISILIYCEYIGGETMVTLKLRVGLSPVAYVLFYSQIRCSVPHNNATLASILQCSCAIIVPSKLHRNLQVATVSISTNLWISILSWQIFADKNTAKQLILFGSIFISENLPGKH